MPPSSKRSKRVKRELAGYEEGNETLNSSPTRAAKRRKTNTKENVNDPATDPIRLPKSQDDIDLDPEALIEVVSQHLGLGSGLIQVTIDHDNEKHIKTKKDVQAYAKIVGKHWTFYVQEPKINIGRPPEGTIVAAASPTAPAATNDSQLSSSAENNKIHIDLGPNKYISRHHASIFFDSDQGTWSITVTGRNKAKVNDATLFRGMSATLKNGTVTEIGGVEMMFILPNPAQDPLEIHEIFLRRARLIESNSIDEISPNQTNGRSSSLTRGPTSSGPLPIAPAPPDYKRPNTPLVKGRGNKSSAFAHSPYAGDGSAIMDHIDFRLDENQYEKPPFTYNQLLTQAIISTPAHKRTLSEIYQFILDHYAWYRRADLGKGWQNSVRHNLSLGPGFLQVPRENNEPGKGGYWCFRTDEWRDLLVAEAWGSKRRSPRKGSDSSSPVPNGQGHGHGNVNQSSPSAKTKVSPAYPAQAPSSSIAGPKFTPDHGKKLMLRNGDFSSDGSPLPRRHRPAGGSFGMSDNLTGSPPLLSSYAPEEGPSLATPAPTRRHPHLAPPSTAQRPSQVMPTSSPALFWRYAGDGMTPGGPRFDTSPTKASSFAFGGIPPSSSPPPVKRDGSPYREAISVGNNELADGDDGLDDEPVYDLSKSFVGIGKFHGSNALASTGEHV